MEVSILTDKGKKGTGKITLNESVFAVPVNKALIRQALHVYTVNQRQANAHTKTRAEVSGGGAKPWKQKGTGRARHGSTRSPLWPGGGVTFGPRSNRNFARKLSRKMKKSAIRVTLSLLLQEKKLIVMKDPVIKEKKLTQQFETILNNAKIERSVLVIHSGESKNIYLAGRNIPGVTMLPVNEINVYELMVSNEVILLESAIKKIEDTWGEGTVSTEAKTPKTKSETKKKSITPKKKSVKSKSKKTQS